jgi:hypothetical protein
MQPQDASQPLDGSGPEASEPSAAERIYVEGDQSRRRPPWFAVAIGLIGALALAEGGIELLLRHPTSIPGPLVDAFQQYYRLHGRTILLAIPACVRYDPELLYTLRPGECHFSGREFDTRVAVNSLGVRDDETSLDGPQVVVLGDSYAMGWGVAQEETFPQRIERVTGRKVLNAGVASYGTARELKLLERIDASRLETLIVQYNATDARENRAYYEGGGRLPAPEKGRYESAVSAARSRGRYFPGKHLLAVTATLARQILAVPARAWKENGTPASASRDPGEAWLFLNILREMASRLETPEILVFELSPADTLGRDFMAGVREELRRPEFHALAARVTLLELSDRIGPDELFILDEHLNAAGHAVVAEAVVEALGKPAGFAR